jgi:hypothetical protein
MGIFFKEFNVDKTLERGAFKVWNEIEVGKEVFLELELPAKKTIVVKLEKSKKEEDAKVEKLERAEEGIFGELPEKESEVIRNFLTQDWNDVFEAYICKKDKDAPLYDQRISIAVYIKENKEVIVK